MTKPSTAPTKPAAKSPPAPAYDGPPVSRIRAIKTGHNQYKLVEEVWDTPPTSVRVTEPKTDGVGAIYRVRLYNEEKLGPNRFGDSGL